MEILGTTLAWLALGLPVALVFVHRGRWELGLGLLPFAGCLALLMPMVAAPWLGGSLGGWPWKSLLASVLVAAVARLLLGPATAPEIRSSPLPRWGMAAHLVSLAVLVGSGAFCIWAGVSFAQGVPRFGWDGYQIWLLRAKVLALSDSFPTALYVEPQVMRSQWQYPLLLPSHLAWYLRWASLEVRELYIPLAIQAALLPLATWAMLLRRVPPLLAAAVGLAPLAVSQLFSFHLQAWADPLVILLLAAGVCGALLGALHEDRPLLVAGGVALAAVVAQKNDGILWLAATAISLGLLWLRAGRPLLAIAGDGLRFTLLGIGFFVAWDLTCRRLGLVNAISLEPSQAAAHLPLVLEATVRQILSGPGLYAVPICLVALFVAPRRGIRRVSLGLALLTLPFVYGFGIVGIMSTIEIPPLATADPSGIAWLIRASFHRVWLGVVPVLFWLAVVASTVDPSPSPQDAVATSSSHAAE